MLKSGAYEECGTHRGWAMEVIDDMKLGKLGSRRGFRVRVARCAMRSAMNGTWELEHVRGLERRIFCGSRVQCGDGGAEIVSLLLFKRARVLGLALAAAWIRALAEGFRL